MVKATFSVLAVFVALLLLGSCGHSQMLWGSQELSPRKQAEVDRQPLGSEQNPIRCHMPAGERAYLDRLRCESGERPQYERVGSVGLGPYEAIMDLYEVTCPGESKTTSVYMDMYHGSFIENRPIAGFTITRAPAPAP